MASPVQQALAYAAIPGATVIAGGLSRTFRPPGPKLRSHTQHFAAGVVFAAVAVELLPDIMREHGGHAALLVLAGFALGVALMLAMKLVASRLGGREGGRSPNGLVATVGLDVLVDGLIVGIGFAAGAKEGVLLTLALAVEMLFLGVSVASALGKVGEGRGVVFRVTAGFGAMFAAGATAGVALLGGLSPSAKEVLLSFGAVALLYLFTEELLVEAHAEGDTPIATATFFAGFLVILVLNLLAPG